jgi:hypothetical protein
MLAQLSERIGIAEKYICVTRPRRFGKSVMADMIASFFSKGYDAKEIFDTLQISGEACYQKNRNQYDVIFISFNELPSECTNYRQYISRIERRIKKDLLHAFPDAGIDKEDAVWDILSDIYEECGIRFMFVMDEWDFIFHRDFVTDEDKKNYISFLNNLLKGKAYVLLAYMTGILPISKYSSGSELNMFTEYTMVTESMYDEYFGFTETETDDLYSVFLTKQPHPFVTREGLRLWYNGYHTKSGERVYNPRSVVLSLMNNNLSSYWTSSGPYDEIFYYVKNNVAAVRDDLARMAAGELIPANVREYAAASMELKTKNEIFSAMVVYGFLSYENGCVRIPNKELMDKFDDMLLKENSLGYVHRLAAESSKMLEATLREAL